jgi:catechol 2,3-dioxygenase-like lactoylglutathione lyase family enzyme
VISLIDHVAITVKDLQETIDFYAKLGFKLGQRAENPT